MNPNTIETAGTVAVGSGAVLGDTDDWNPVAWQGTKWFTFRETSTGAYAEMWYEVDRNKLGRVTVCPSYGWKTGSPHTTLDKQLKDLLTEEQLAQRMSAVKKIHPAMQIAGIVMSPNVQSSGTRDQPASTAKRNWNRHPALPAAI